MAGQLTVAGRNAILDGTAMPDPMFLQLHTGDPTDAGTANVSTDVASGSRMQVEFDAASAGATDNTNEETASITVSETISHWSLWSLGTGGVCWWYGSWDTSRAYVNGDTARVVAGDLDLSIT